MAQTLSQIDTLNVKSLYQYVLSTVSGTATVTGYYIDSNIQAHPISYSLNTSPSGLQLIHYTTTGSSIPGNYICLILKPNVPLWVGAGGQYSYALPILGNFKYPLGNVVSGEAANTAQILQISAGTYRFGSRENPDIISFYNSQP